MKRSGEGGGEAPGFRSLIHSLVRLTMHTRTPFSLLLNSCFGISLGKGPACLILANICFRLAGRILGASSGVSFTVWLSGGVGAGSFLGRNPLLAVPVSLPLFVLLRLGDGARSVSTKSSSSAASSALSVGVVKVLVIVANGCRRRWWLWWMTTT